MNSRDTYNLSGRRRTARRRRRKRRLARIGLFFVCAASLLVLGYVLYWGGHMMTGYVAQRQKNPESETVWDQGTAADRETVWDQEAAADREAAWDQGTAADRETVWDQEAISDGEDIWGQEAAKNAEGTWDSGTTGGQGASEIDLAHLYSRYAILVDAETGETLAECAGGEQMYPASLTKMMTAVLMIENAESMDDRIVVPEEIFPQLYAEEASMAGFLPGEEAAVRDLLYGILLPSGAECCLAAAVKYAGSEEAFVEQMNEKAAELGMSGTHFCNCTGLHARDHYTTAEDLARLLRYALQYEDFREAFTSGYYVVQPNYWHSEGFTMHSTMFESMDEEALECGILGGKTGYTEEAGLCLASLAQIEGREYLLVTAGAEGSHETRPFHIMDAVSVYQQIAGQTG